MPAELHCRYGERRSFAVSGDCGVQDDGGAGRSGRHCRGGRPGRRRIRGASTGLLRRTAAYRAQVRHIDRRRRSAVWNGPNGEDVCVRALEGLPSGHHCAGKRYRFGHASWSHDSPLRIDDMGTRSACFHVRRKSGVPCGGTGNRAAPRKRVRLQCR